MGIFREEGSVQYVIVGIKPPYPPSTPLPPAGDPTRHFVAGAPPTPAPIRSPAE